MFQYQPMNRRLVYVFLEGFLETMFPQYKFPELFVKLHSRSPRINRYNQKLKCASLKRWQERTEATGHRSTRNTQTWELRVRAWAMTWKLRYMCPISALPLPSHTLYQWKHSNYPVDFFFFFLSRQNWKISNTHMSKHKSCNLHQAWTGFSFSLRNFCPPFKLFSCV